MSPRIFHMHLYDQIYKNKIKKILDVDEILVKAKEEGYEITY